ncbi:MAG: glycosyltransferase family 39 protein, partial [Planctomycetota bacterium]|nr:glycosyltransferase family 39 protein [Planctomycetota bacterium]
MQVASNDARRSSFMRRPRAGSIALIVIAGILVALGLASAESLRTVFVDGPVAAAIVAAATGLGLWIFRGLRLHHADAAWQIIGGAGLGLGALSLLMLGLGSSGILDRTAWIVLLATLAISGVWRVCVLMGGSSAARAEETEPWIRWLWLTVIVFGALALAAATIPPGILWPPEGNGYDVLEYHLGAPREYFEAGRIEYLPHNIYGNFPFNVEMLYLLTIVLHDDPVSAVFSAQLLNAFLGMLAVATIWLAGREYGPVAGVIAAIAAATVPFLTYLSGIAYVENGMLLFAALALAAMIRASREQDGSTGRWLTVSGLAAGLSCGCKYTAVVMILLPLAVACLWLSLRRNPRRPTWSLIFIAACAVTFGPWLIRNTVNTGNPVFPLARSVMPERAGVWNDDGAARWHEGHLPDPAHRSIGGRLTRLWHEVIGSEMFGPVIPLSMALGGFSMLARRRKSATTDDSTAAADIGGPACWLMIAVGLVAWLSMTHLAGRFAVGLIVPAAVLLGRSWPPLLGTNTRILTAGAIVLIAAFNTRSTLVFFREYHTLDIAPNAVAALDMIKRGEWGGQAHIPVLNEHLAAGRRILMIGDARRFYLQDGADYCVVFNRNPFAEAAERLSAGALMGWLREHDYDFVYVDWSEMQRLRTSRYGFWE